MRAILLLFFYFSLSFTGLAQSINIGEPGTMSITPEYYVRVNSGKPTKLITYDQSSKISLVDYPKLKPLDLWRLSTDLTGGIRGTIDQPNGYITLSVYALSQRQDIRRGALLYQAKLINSNPTSYSSISVSTTSPVGSGTVNASNVRVLLQQADVASGNDVRVLYTNTACSYNAMALTFAAFDKDSVANPVQKASVYSCVADGNYMDELPVVIDVEIANATLYDVKIPTIGIFNIAKFLHISGRGSRDGSEFGKVTMYVNGNKVLDGATVDNQNQVINNVKLGDKLRLEIEAPSQLFAKDYAPTVEGITDRWIARFAGDLQYYCSPNVLPGSYKPWIGFDTRVHYLLIPTQGQDVVKKYKEWTVTDNPSNGRKVYSYEWTASMETDPLLEKYAPAYEWPKLDNSKTPQRHNQKEGLNMEILSYYNNSFSINRNSLYKQNNNPNRFILGGDEDELIYLNWRTYDTKGITPDASLLKLNYSSFKSIPEGDNRLSKRTGYPYAGYPVNLMVSAYQRNRISQEAAGNATPALQYQTSSALFTDMYDGFEIQDKGTGLAFTNGNGREGINKMPGTISVNLKALNQSIKFKTVVVSPLSDNGRKLGFYGCIDGVKWPAQYGSEAYTLKGLDGLSSDEVRKFSVEYAYQNEFGEILRETKYVKDLNDTQILTISQKGVWTNYFVIKPAVYSSITAYYGTSDNRVMVGGKELLPIKLRFCGITKINNSNPGTELEKIGNGVYIFEEDFRTKPYDRFQVPSKTLAKTDMFRSRYGRTYVFKKGDVVSFTTYDSDPHTLFKSDDVFYLSAKGENTRVPWDSLDGNVSKKPFLKYYLWKSFNAATPKAELKDNRTGPNLTYTFNEPGEFDLEINYRDSSYIFHRIIVKDNGQSSIGKGTQKASIQYRDLSEDEAKWLGLTPERTKQLHVAEIRDIYSEYKYVTGPRGSNPDNRWGMFRDYADTLRWEGRNGGGFLLGVNQTSEVRTYISQYEQNVRLKWFPKAWDLHFSSNWLKELPNGLPPYVPKEKVNLLNSPTDLSAFSNQISQLFANRTTVSPWQYIMGLISYTDYHGYRVRYNPKCFYDTYAIFDNKTGAFSGNPTLPQIPQVSSPDYEDTYKDQQDFFYNLKHKRILVVDKRDTYDLFVAYNAKSEEYMADEPFYPVKDPKNFSVGADISWVTEMERDGIRFYDDTGTEKDLFAIMKDKKMNTIRLRAFVNPGDGWSGEKDFLLKARRAADYGFKIMVDIHYSDVFADPEHQAMPKDWEGLTVNQLGDKVYNYTRELLLKLKAQKIPDASIAWVQVGNEINSGMMRSKTKNGTGGWFGFDNDKGEPNGYQNCAFFFNKGYEAVKSVYGQAKVILHLTYKQEDFLSTVIANLNQKTALAPQGLQFDVIGLSLYPGDNVWEYAPGYSNQEAVKTMNSLITKFGKEVMAVECGMGYVYDAQYRDFLWDLTNKMKYHIKDGKGLGVNIWEPQASEIYYEGAPIYEKLKFKGYGKGAFKNGRPGIAFDKFKADTTTKTTDYVRVYLVNNDYKRPSDAWTIRLNNKNGGYAKFDFMQTKFVELRYYKAEKRFYFYLSDGMPIDVFQGGINNRLLLLDGANLRNSTAEDQDRLEFNTDGSIIYKCNSSTVVKLITDVTNARPNCFETMDIEGQGIDNYNLPAHLTSFKAGDDLYIVVSAVPHSYKGVKGGTDYLARRFNTGRYVFSQAVKDLSKLTVRVGNLTNSDLSVKELVSRTGEPTGPSSFAFPKNAKLDYKYAFQYTSGTLSNAAGQVQSTEFSKGASVGLLGEISEFMTALTGEVVTWRTLNQNQYPLLYFKSKVVDMSTYSTFHGLIETGGLQTDNGRTKQIYVRPRLVKNYDNFTLYIDLVELPENAASARLAAEETPAVAEGEPVRLFPNPTKDLLIVDWEKETTGEVDILIQNVAGVSMFQQKQVLGTDKQLSIKIPELPDGNYIILLKTPFSKVTKRFVIQH